MRYVVDTYILEYLENEDKYYIYFKDSVNKDCKIEINKEIFDEYMKAKRSYKKIQNQYDRYEEQSEQTEINLYKRTLNKAKNIEDEVIENINKEQLIQAKKELTETQLRRIELHIEEEITLEEIAYIEGVRKNKIDKSIAQGMKKLKKFFKVGGQNVG